MKPLLFPLALASLVPAVLGAQRPGDTVQLEPVVVTATRLPTRAGAVPEAVTVLSGAELRAAGITTVFEALREVPGAAVVQTGSFGGQTSLFLRGGQSNYVKVLVDGVPVNQPGGSYDFANLTTDNVDRIEVLRGPASVLYGSDAVTGVVQIFTRAGMGPGQADLSLQGGTYGTQGFAAGVAGASAGRGVTYSVGASRFASDGMYAFNNRYHNTVFSSLLRATPDTRTDATFSLRYDDNAYHFPTNGAGVPVDRNQFNFGSGPTIGLDVGRRFTSRLETRLLLTVNATEGGFDNHPDSTADPNLFHSLDKLRRTGADVRANFHLPAGAVLTGGAAVEQERGQSSNTCQTQFGDCSSPPVDTSRWNRALYAQAVTEVAGRVSVTAGLRFEDNQRFGTFVTYRLGAAYRVARDTRFRATAGNAFREPTFFENFATGYAVGNPKLRPERSSSWELGLDQSLDRGRVSLSATFFDQRFRDMIDYDPSAPTGAPNYENVAGVTANGVELGLHAAPIAPLALGIGYTYLHTDITNPGFDPSSGAALAAGRPLLRRPEHTARLDADYRVRDRGTLSLAVIYVGTRQDQDFATYPFPRVTLPAYARMDVAAQLDVLRSRQGRREPGVALSVRAENLLDHAYEEAKNFPARGRTIFLGARLALAY